MAVVLIGLLIFAAIAFFFYLVLWEKARYVSDMFLIL
jgi:ABC-type glucose/galactose transport system permease subunit